MVRSDYRVYLLAIDVLVIQGVGAKRATVAQAAEHVPSAALHARRAGGAAEAATTVPKMAPAAP
jgi:hypothetical protein